MENMETKVLDLKITSYKNEESYFHYIPHVEWFDPEKHSLKSIFTDKGYELLWTFLINSIGSTKFVGVERFNIKSGIALLSVPTVYTTKYTAQNKDDNLPKPFTVCVNLSKLQEYWDMYIEQYADDMCEKFLEIGITCEKDAIDVLKHMLYVHIEPGNSYVEFRIAAPRV